MPFWAHPESVVLLYISIDVTSVAGSTVLVSGAMEFMESVPPSSTVTCSRASQLVKLAPRIGGPWGPCQPLEAPGGSWRVMEAHNRPLEAPRGPWRSLISPRGQVTELARQREQGSRRRRSSILWLRKSLGICCPYQGPSIQESAINACSIWNHIFND